MKDLFGWLPFSLVKGEILDMIPQEKFDVIYNKGVFIMPRSEDKYLVGATYETVNIEEGITEKARNTLIEKLNAIFKINYHYMNIEFRKLMPKYRYLSFTKSYGKYSMKLHKTATAISWY